MKYQINRELIRQKIAAEGLARDEAAAKIGVSVAMLAHILKSGTCGGKDLGKVAKFVGVPAYQLVI